MTAQTDRKGFFRKRKSGARRAGMLLLLFLLAGCTMTEQTLQPQKQKVAVIVKSTESAFWKSVLAGANAAASEYNIDFSFEGPQDEEDWETQNQLIDRAIEDGAGAIVFSAIDYEASVQALERAAELGLHIIIIDSDVKSERVSVRIGTDNFKAGQRAAYALLNTSDKLKIGMVGFDTHSENGRKREQGFEDIVSGETGAEIVAKINCVSQSDLVKKETEALLRAHPEINAIVTFNELTTLGVGYAIEALGLGDQIRVVGFDNNVISVGMLETGEIDALIVQNPFAMGYLGVEAAATLLSGKNPPSDKVDTEVRAISREDMYTEQNQKFLFSFTENIRS